MATSKAWSQTVEHMGQSVRLYQRGSTIYREVRTASGKDRKSLGHGDQKQAEDDARALCEHLADLAINPDKRPDSLTLGRLRRLYLAAERDGLSSQRRRFVQTTLGLFESHLGEGFAVVDFSKNTAKSYVRARRSGSLKPDAHERRTADTPSDGTLRNELAALSTVANWATAESTNGVRLLSLNPVKGTYKWLRYDKEDRARPRVSEGRYRKLLEVADDVDPAGRFRVLLVLAWQTGRRINAMAHLRVSDVLTTPDAINAALAAAGQVVEVQLPDGSKAEVGKLWKTAIRWRAEHDKVGRQTFAPVSPKVAEAVTAYMKASGRIGDAWLFPRAKDGDAIDKQQAGYWLRRAETLAEVPHIRRGGWHAFRRAWAHRHKHKSPHDVAAVGGWFDLAALQDAYQSSDPASMLSVVNGDG